MLAVMRGIRPRRFRSQVAQRRRAALSAGAISSVATADRHPSLTPGRRACSWPIERSRSHRLRIPSSLSAVPRGMAQTTAGQHGDRQVACSPAAERQNQRNLVSDASGGVLVSESEGLPRRAAQRELARVEHRPGQCSTVSVDLHTVRMRNRHQKGGKLWRRSQELLSTDARRRWTRSLLEASSLSPRRFRSSSS